MNKLIYRKLLSDILLFFLITSACITLIVWVVQAVNYLDIVSEDGHSLKVYFTYTFLSLPKIFSRTLIFVFFISIFYVLNKYESNNEILIFWINGIKKINFINFILKFSLVFIILQIILSLYIVPNAQNLGRNYLKKSNVDFLPKLITDKKFVDVVKNLTIFIEEYKPNGNLEKIYIKEKIDNEKSKIIVAKKGKILKQTNGFFLELFDGAITNVENEKTYHLKYSRTEYDLSKFSPKTVTHTKIQETSSLKIIKCLQKFYYTDFLSEKGFCKKSSIKQISQEMFKRLILPVYIFILSLIGASLIIKPKNNIFLKFQKINLFLVGIFIIILGQISINLVGDNIQKDLIISMVPVFAIVVFYLILLLKTNFNLSKL